MSDESIHGLRPDQVDRIFSLGSDQESEQPKKDPRDQEALPGGEGDRDAVSHTSQSDQNLLFPGRAASHPGQSIGQYKLLEKIGEGGMGEVYRATDTKLDRDVAIKILPESYAGDRNRVARFKREAKALAALNHPNIAVIHGIEHHNETHALVMELVEGETLGERLKREPMTVEETLECCQQIAEALEAAHEKGIIHRDLKPENVKIASDGHVKVLDFGLAKMLETKPGDPASLDDQAKSPTTTHMIRTARGELLGTAPYMSPEQARAKPVDKRSDIWSFGCVLFECLTGKRTFQGEDVTETLAAIIKGEPDWAALPEDTPPTIHLLLRKCLNKDRRRRLQSIADARVDLEQALGNPTSSIIRLSDGAIQEMTPRPGYQRLVAIVAVAIACLLAVLLAWSLKPDPPRQPIRRISMELGVEGHLAVGMGTAARLSRDGSILAYIVQAGEDPPKLYLRRLDQQLEPTELTAAENLNQFCFSPDGQWIATIGGGTLAMVSVNGGSAIPLCEPRGVRGIDWADDGSIIIGSWGSGLLGVPSSGGTLESVTTLSDEEQYHRWPQFLPGAHAVLYTAHNATGSYNNANIMVQRIGQGDPQLVWQGGYHARYMSSGHLVYIHSGTLYAAAFDLESLEITGQPSPVVEEVLVNSNGGAQFDVSADGTLVYVRGGSIGKMLYELEWVDREGNRELLPLLPANYRAFKISPDGNSLAYGLDDGEQMDIWIYDFERGFPTPFTFDPANDGSPIWSPTGESIVFSSNRDGIHNLYWKRADSSGEAQRLTDSPNPQHPKSWHPDSRHLAIAEGDLTMTIGAHLRVVNLEGDDRSGWTAGETTDFQATQFSEGRKGASFSPDGDWLAYTSDKSGQYQVFVREFPDRGGGPERISIVEVRSDRPRWSRTSPELLFATNEIPNSWECQIYTATYRVEEGKFIPGNPVRW